MPLAAWSFFLMSGPGPPIPYQRTGGGFVIRHCIDLYRSLIPASYLWLFLLQMVSSAALIRVSDWYSKARAARTGSSIEELEALFLLRDLRDVPVYRGRR
jgi:hypothetical protein